MVVSVQFLGIQRQVAHIDEIQVPLLEEARVTDVIRYLEEHYPDLSLNDEGVLVSVNNRISNPDRILETHDRVAFIPHIGGG